MRVALAVPAQAATTSEPLLFENVGEVISGLSYVHSVILLDIQALDQHAQEYQSSLEREFGKEQLERTHWEFVQILQEKTRVNHSTDSLNYDRSVLQRWEEIGRIHIAEVERLRDRIRMLYETIPPPENVWDGPKGQFDIPPPDDLWNQEYHRHLPKDMGDRKLGSLT